MTITVQSPPSRSTAKSPFNVFWPKLQEAVAGIESASPATPLRKDREVLDEVLGILRSQVKEDARGGAPSLIGWLT